MTDHRPIGSTRSGQIVRIIVGLACLSLLPGCGGGTSSDGGQQQPPPGSIGIAGGTVKSSDGKVVLTIPQNAITVDTVFTIEPSTGAAPPSRAVSAVYDVEPTGIVFASSALPQLTIDYGTVPNGVDPSTLTIGTQTNGQWGDVPGSHVNQANHTVTAPLQHLSPYAVLQPSGDPNSTGNHPPVITNVAIPATGTTNQPVTFSGAASDNDGDVLTYTWNLGDGSPLQANTIGMVTHAYSIAATYNVTLTVTDGHGGTAIPNAQAIVISEPPGNHPPVITSMIMPTPSSVIAGQPINVDATASDQDRGDAITFSWNFGDGPDNTPASLNAKATHVYNNAGSYDITLTVSDGRGSPVTKKEPIKVLAPPNSPPVAHAGGPYVGVVGEGIPFSAVGSSDPDGNIDMLTYTWNFGDTTPTLTGVSVTHAYSSAATYAVTVTVVDPAGASNTATTTATISTVTPGNSPPTVSVTVPPQGLVLQNLVLRGAASDPDVGDTLTYSWNFGDGNSTAFGPTVSVVHEYAQAGTYVATLTVNDGQGHSVPASGTTVITLPARPVAFPRSVLILRRTDNFGPNLYRNVIELDGSGVAPLHFNVVTYPTNWARDAKTLDVFATLAYQWWDPIADRYRPECQITQSIPATCFSTISSHVDFILDPGTQLPTGTGAITMTPSTAPSTVNYTPERCWVWPGLSDSFAYTVTDGNGFTSAPAVVTILLRANMACNYIPP